MIDPLRNAFAGATARQRNCPGDGRRPAQRALRERAMQKAAFYTITHACSGKCGNRQNPPPGIAADWSHRARRGGKPRLSLRAGKRRHGGQAEAGFRPVVRQRAQRLCRSQHHPFARAPHRWRAALARRVTRWRFEAAQHHPLSQRLHRRARRQALFDSSPRFPRAPAPAAPPLGRGAVPPSPTRTPVWCSAERWPPAALSPRRRPRPPARNAPVGAPNRRGTPPSRRSPAAFQCRERRRRNTRYSLKWPHQSPPFSQKGRCHSASCDGGIDPPPRRFLRALRRQRGSGPRAFPGQRSHAILWNGSIDSLLFAKGRTKAAASGGNRP